MTPANIHDGVKYEVYMFWPKNELKRYMNYLDQTATPNPLIGQESSIEFPTEPNCYV